MAGFELITIAADDYPDAPGLGPLEASAIAERFAGILTAGGDVVDEPTHLIVRNKTEIDEVLETWSRSGEARSSIVYVVGHGEADGHRHRLLVPDPERGYAEIETIGLAKYFRNEWTRRRRDPDTWALFILDCCKSQVGIGNLAFEFETAQSSRPRRIGLWPVNVEGAATLGTFVDAFARSMERGFTRNDDSIRLDEVFRLARAELGDVDKRYDLPDSAVLSNPRHRDLAGATAAARVMLTVDSYDELNNLIAGLEPDLRNHFLTKAQGAESGELAWYFVGRDAEIAELCAWFDTGESGMRVVTGDAGSGKSALLGHLAVLADRELTEAYASLPDAAHLLDAPSPGDGVFDATIHLTGKTLHDLIVALQTDMALGENTLLKRLGIEPASVLSRPSGGSGSPMDEVMDNLLDRITASFTSSSVFGMLEARWPVGAGAAPFTVLVDALDEAQEPEAIAHFLAELGSGEHNARVLVGTRRSTAEGPDTPPDPNKRGLLDRLGADDDAILVLERDEGAAEEYAFRRLGAAGFGTADARTLARRIAAAGEHFLFARLVSAEIAASFGTAMPSPDQLDALLAGGHRGVFRSAVERIRNADPPVACVLEALSRARGRGVPRDRGVWLTLAGVVGDSKGVAVTEGDIDRALETVGRYITLDAEAGMSTYRLAHRTFAEFYLYESGTRAFHAEIAQALIDRCRGDGWLAANYYEVRYVLEHLMLAGAEGATNDFDEVTHSPTWLHRALQLLGVDALVDTLTAASLQTPSVISLIYALQRSLVTLGARPELAGPVLYACGPRPNRISDVGRSVAHLADRPWLQMSDGIFGWEGSDRAYSSPGKCRALAMGDVEGRPLIAIGIDDRVEFWDPLTSGPDASKSIMLPGRATALAFCEVDDLPAIAAVMSYDSLLHVYRLDGTLTVPEIPLDGSYVTAVAVGDLGGSTVAALGAVEMGELSLYRLEDGAHVDSPVDLSGADLRGLIQVEGELAACLIRPLSEPIVVGSQADAVAVIEVTRIADGDLLASTPTTDLMAQAIERIVGAVVTTTTWTPDERRTDADLVRGTGLVLCAVVGDHLRAWAPEHASRLDWESPVSDEPRSGIRCVAVGEVAWQGAVVSCPDLDATALIDVQDLGTGGSGQYLVERGGALVGGAAAFWRRAPHAAIPEPGSVDALVIGELVDWPHTSYQEATIDGRRYGVTGSIGSSAVVWDLETTPATIIAGPFNDDDSWQRYETVATKGGPISTRDAAIGVVPGHGLSVAIAARGGVRLVTLAGTELELPLTEPDDVTSVAMGVLNDSPMLVAGSQSGHIWTIDVASRQVVAEFSFNEPIFDVAIDEADNDIAVETSTNKIYRFVLNPGEDNTG